MVGHQPGPSSHGIGEPRALGRVWDQTIWRLSSTVSEEADLEEHLSELGRRAQEIGLFESSRIPGDVLRVLNVAVMNEEVSCTTVFPSALLLPFLTAGFELSVTVYLVDKDS